MNTIVATLSDRFQIRLKNVKEVFGHDDSIPFNAEVWIKENRTPWKKIGKASNDGWGGDANINIDPEYQELWKDVVKDIECIPWETKFGKFNYNAPMLCDFMACWALDGDKVFDFATAN